MANTWIEYIGSGSQADYPFAFPYLDESHIFVYLDDAQSTQGGAGAGDYTFFNASTIRFNSNVGAGVEVRIQRITPTTPLVDFSVPGLKESDLDTATWQGIYLAEENRDQVENTLFEAINISYSNSLSGFTATDVQSAIDENDYLRRQLENGLVQDQYSTASSSVTNLWDNAGLQWRLKGLTPAIGLGWNKPFPRWAMYDPSIGGLTPSAVVLPSGFNIDYPEGGHAYLHTVYDPDQAAPAPNNQVEIGTVIPDMNRCIGREMVLSVSIRSDRAFNAQVKTHSHTGDAGGQSHNLVGNVEAIPGDNQWARYVFKFTVPNYSYINWVQEDSYNFIKLYLDGWSTGVITTFDIMNPMLTFGDVEQPFEYVTLAETRRRCQSMIRATWPDNVAQGTATFDGAITAQQIVASTGVLKHGRLEWETPMWGVPAMTIYSTTGLVNNVWSDGGDREVTSLDWLSRRGAGILYTAHLTQASAQTSCHYVADCQPY